MNTKRMRGRNQFRNGGGGGGGGGGPPMRSQTGGIPMNRNHVFDSTGPEMRVRGTAQQLFEKYLQLGRDATGSGDRVMAEGYFQHAEHYFRIINAMNQAAQQNQGQQPHQGHQGGGGGQGQGGGHPQGGPQPGQYNSQQHNGPARRVDEEGGEQQDGYEPEEGFQREPEQRPHTTIEAAREIPIGTAPPEG